MTGGHEMTGEDGSCGVGECSDQALLEGESGEHFPAVEVDVDGSLVLPHLRSEVDFDPACPICCSSGDFN